MFVFFQEVNISEKWFYILTFGQLHRILPSESDKTVHFLKIQNMNALLISQQYLDGTFLHCMQHITSHYRIIQWVTISISPTHWILFWKSPKFCTSWRMNWSKLDLGFPFKSAVYIWKMISYSYLESHTKFYATLRLSKKHKFLTNFCTPKTFFSSILLASCTHILGFLYIENDFTLLHRAKLHHSNRSYLMHFNVKINKNSARAGEWHVVH